MAVRVNIGEEHLEVLLDGWDRILSVKGRLLVPLDAITEVECKHRSEIQRLPGRWLRLPGTYVPSMVHHGSYGRRPNRNFWALFRQERVLVIRCNDWDYRRLVLAIDDCDARAREISTALPGA